jgi:hypothetical protein
MTNEGYNAMASKQVAFRVNHAQHAMLERSATDEGLTVSEYIRDLVMPPVDKLIHMASGGKYPRSMVQMVLAAAEEAADSSEWGTAACDWIEKADRLIGWLRAHPWHPESYSRTVALMDEIPQEIKKVIESGVRELLK